MPHDIPDQPLTITDLDERQYPPLGVLALRVVAHLEGDWHVTSNDNTHAYLQGPDELKLHFSLWGDSAMRRDSEFHVSTFTLTGRVSEPSTPMQVFALPSAIAAEINATIISAVRKRHAAARREREANARRNDGRKARIGAIAERLQWNASSYATQSGELYASINPRLVKRRNRGEQPVLSGRISYDDRNGGMNVYLNGLSETLVDQIVDLIATHTTDAKEQQP